MVAPAMVSFRKEASVNIIFVVIDTLRYDYIHAHGANDWIQTPNIDCLAASSLVFDRTYAASYPTIPHRTDVMTGEYGWPYQGPFHPWMPLRFDVPTLPRLLARAGYATQLIHDTPHMANGGHAFDWPFAAWTFIRGAEVDRPWIDDQGLAPLESWTRDPLFDFVDESKLSSGERRLLLTYARAHRRRQRPEDWSTARLFRTATDFIRDNTRRGDRQEGSFFLWVDCFDPHEPWDVPPDFVKRYDQTPDYDGRVDPRAFSSQARQAVDGAFPEGVRERQTAFYAAKVTWVDHWFGQVLAALDETGLDRKTAIVLTADHGTNLGERGGFGKTGVINEQEAHVPLMIHLPDGPTGRSDTFVQPQDISTTLLHMAGAERPAAWVGHNLLNPQASQAADTPRAIALTGHSVNSWSDDPERPFFSVFDRDWYMNLAARPEACRLYRYGSVTDIAADYPEVVARLRIAGIEEAARRGTDPKLIDWLRSEGTIAFPEECTRWTGPAAWRTYWERVYEE